MKIVKLKKISFDVDFIINLRIQCHLRKKLSIRDVEKTEFKN